MKGHLRPRFLSGGALPGIRTDKISPILLHSHSVINLEVAVEWLRCKTLCEGKSIQLVRVLAKSRISCLPL
jgi:hypothetical protein